MAAQSDSKGTPDTPLLDYTGTIKVSIYLFCQIHFLDVSIAENKKLIIKDKDP